MTYGLLKTALSFKTTTKHYAFLVLALGFGYKPFDLKRSNIPVPLNWLKDGFNVINASLNIDQKGQISLFFTDCVIMKIPESDQRRFEELVGFVGI